MKRSTKIVLMSIGLLAFIIVVSSSYAYFTYMVDGDSPTGVTGAAHGNGPKLEVSENMDGINLSNSYPMPDANGLATAPYTITAKNNESSKILKVTVALEVYSTNTLSDSLVNIALNDNVRTLGSITDTTTVSKSIFSKAYKLNTFTLNPGENKSIDIRMWINENANTSNAQNKVWSSKVTLTPVYQ